MTVTAHLAKAAKRAAELSDPDTCLIVMLVPGGLSIVGSRNGERRYHQLRWDQLDAPSDPVTPAVDAVRRALLTIKSSQPD